MKYRYSPDEYKGLSDEEKLAKFDSIATSLAFYRNICEKREKQRWDAEERLLKAENALLDPPNDTVLGMLKKINDRLSEVESKIK